jgi:hypothetical protein
LVVNFISSQDVEMCIIFWKQKFEKWWSFRSLQLLIQPKKAWSELFLRIIRHIMACTNYWNSLSVAESILVKDIGGHWHAILHELREKFESLAQTRETTRLLVWLQSFLTYGIRLLARIQW